MLSQNRSSPLVSMKTATETHGRLFVLALQSLGRDCVAFRKKISPSYLYLIVRVLWRHQVSCRQMSLLDGKAGVDVDCTFAIANHATFLHLKERPMKWFKVWALNNSFFF